MKININNADKLTTAINAAEGAKVSARTISAVDIQTVTREIERNLSTRLLKKDWQGLVFRCDPHAQSFPGAYRGLPESTHFALERGASAWFVTSIGRSPTLGPTDRIIPVNIQEKAEQLIKFTIEKAFI